MKKKFLGLLVGLSAAIALVAGFAAPLAATKEAAPVEASSSSYWSTWISNNSSAISTGGNTLMSALHTKISSGTTKISYNDLWAAYKTSDIVPGYESNSDSSKKIWDMYAGLQYTYQSSGSGIDTGTVGGGYNREHSIPNSWWNKTEDERYSDLVCLIPTDGKVNGVRSNYVFGVVNGTASQSYAMPQQKDKSGNIIQIAGNSSNNEYSKLGTGKSYAGTSPGTVFEPADQYKGDFARIYMYFACRYQGAATSTTDGSRMFKTSYPYVTDYTKEILKLWHVSDPVSEKEINRNNAVESLQGNRNPFVDYPEWANSIFGTSYSESASSETLTLDKSSASIAVDGTTTITATASGGSGSVTWSTSDATVASISASSNVVTVTGKKAGSASITATYGSKTASCTVTVSASGGGSSGSYTIAYGDTFSPAFPTASGSVNTSSTSHTDSTSGITFKEQGIYKGSSNSYLMFAQNKGFLFNTASLGTITSVVLNYNSGTSTTGKTGVYFGSTEQSTYTTTSNATINSTDLTDTFTNTTTGNGFFQVSTSNKNVQITSIIISYNSGSSSAHTISLSGSDSVVVGSTISLTATHSGSDTITWSSNNTAVATVSSVGVVTGVAAGTATITAECAGGGTASKYITVHSASEKTLSSIAVSGQTTTFNVGDTFDFDGTVTATYSDSTTDDVTANASFSGYNMSNAGNQTVTVSFTYNGTTKSTTYSITVNSSGGGSTYEYQKITSTGNLTSGDYLIVCESQNVAFNGALTTLDAVSNTISVTIANNTIESNSTTDGAAFTYDSSATSLKSASGYYIGRTANSNGFNSSQSTAYTHTITFDSGNAIITSSGGPNLRYNASSGQTRFRYFTSAQTAVQLYKKVDTSAATVSVSSVSLDKETATISVGGNVTLTPTVLPNDATDKSVSWSSSSEAIAKVNNGVVTGYSVGSATITVTTTDGSKTATCTVTVEASSNNFKLITSSSELIEGTKVTIGAQNDGDYYAPAIYNSGNFISTVHALCSDGILTPFTGFEQYTIGIVEYNENTCYTFKDSNNNYLYNASNNDNSYLKTKSSLDNTCYWNIAITIENNNVSFAITNVGNTTRNSLMFNYNNGSPRFSCYTSGQTAVQLFANVTAGTQAFVDGFMHMTDYSGDGTGLCYGTNGYYFTAKNQLIAMGSAYITEFQGNDTFNAAQLRYETWAGKNNDNNPYVASSQTKFIENNEGNIGLITTIATIVISTAAIGSFILLKKKKETSV